MESRIKFEKIITIRLFNKEFQKIKHIIDTVRFDDGFNKYDSESHFIRCAIITLLREEYKKI